MSDVGFFKIHRSVKGKLSGTELGLLVCLLSDARWEKHPKKIEKILVKRGQLVTTMRRLALEYGFHRMTLKRALDFLVSNGTITIEPFEKLSLITIVNYSKYQDIQKSDVPVTVPVSVPTTVPVSVPTTVPTCVPVSSESSSEYRELDPSKKGRKEEGKKLRNEEVKNVTLSSERKGSRSSPPSEHDVLLGTRWADWANSEHPHLKAKPEAYALAIQKTKKAKQLGEKEIDFIFDFIISDSFWSENCQSPAGLLKESKNGVKKIDNILAKMKQKYRDDIFIANLQKSDGDPKPKTEYIF